MSCCLTYAEAIAKIREIAEIYHPTDYKIFVARREPRGLFYAIQVGLTVTPDDIKNTSMFRDFEKLQDSTDTSCIKTLYSQVDLRDTRTLDLFVLEIELEDLS